MRKSILLIALPLLLTQCGKSDNKDGVDVTMLQYQEILQLSLDVDTLQPYFHTTPDGQAYPVVIADDVAAQKKPGPRVEKFGEAVTFITKAEADTSNLESYFWVTDYIYLDSTARMILLDPIRDIYFGVAFDRVDDTWRVASTYIDTGILGPDGP